jgi:hypothetical protein
MAGAVGIEIASLIYKSHRTKALPTALGFISNAEIALTDLSGVLPGGISNYVGQSG